MPRSPAQFEAMRQASQEKIIKSACKLFGQFGFQATSISMIARDSGVSGGLIYAYFEDKERLLDRVLAQTFTNIDSVFGEILPVDTKSSQIEERVALVFDLVTKRISCFRLLIQLMVQDGTPAPAIEQIRALLKHFRVRVIELFPDLKDNIIPEMIHSAVTSYLVYNNEDMFSQQRDSISELAKKHQREMAF